MNDRIYKDVNLLLDESPDNSTVNQQNAYSNDFSYNNSNVEYKYENCLEKDYFMNHKKDLINSDCTNEGYESNKH